MTILAPALRSGLMIALAFGIGLQMPRAADLSTTPTETATRGQRLLREIIEVNQFWLIGPPEAVGPYRYVFHLNNRDPMTVEVAQPRRVGQAKRQGITWHSTLQALARNPAQATVREISETNGVATLSFRLEPGVKGHCGNGIENTWAGYFNLGGDFAEVVVDLKRKVPLRSVLGRLEETYGDFVQVDAEHLVPLSVTVEREDSMRFDWRFRLYEPGLWLLDCSDSDGRKVAWIDGVVMGKSPARLQAATAVSVEREAAERAGSARLAEFLAANRNWLLPSLEARRGLVYDYEQEAGYRERVIFDREGNVMVRLESSKEEPGTATRERLWAMNGKRLEARLRDPFVQATVLAGNAAPGTLSGLEAWLRQDRSVQTLAMGLALECALTRLAREPGAFGAETSPLGKVGKAGSSRYLLVLHPRKQTRLFAGTMLMFTSWAYMHDVNYTRSEIVCDAATHRPLEEKDFEGSKLAGHFRFEDWGPDGTGLAPGRIRAVMPYEKDHKDGSLEIDARFHLPRPGVWLLERVESAFRGGGGGSTGSVDVVTAEAAAFEPIQALLARYKTTDDILRRLDSAKPAVPLKLTQGEWQDIALAADWTATARESASWREDRKTEAPPPVIGVYRARAASQSDGGMLVELEGITTAYWKEFDTVWAATGAGGGNEIVRAKATSEIRAESSPGAFKIRLEFPAASGLELTTPLILEGTVQRMTGAYHGHGMWYRLAREN